MVCQSVRWVGVFSVLWLLTLPPRPFLSLQIWRGCPEGLFRVSTPSGSQFVPDQLPVGRARRFINTIGCMGESGTDLVQDGDNS